MATDESPLLLYSTNGMKTRGMWVVRNKLSSDEIDLMCVQYEQMHTERGCTKIVSSCEVNKMPIGREPKVWMRHELSCRGPFLRVADNISVSSETLCVQNEYVHGKTSHSEIVSLLREFHIVRDGRR